MFTVILGCPGCPYRAHAKELAKKLTNKRGGFSCRYVDIHVEDISKANLEKAIGKPVETVPQVFVDQEHIGGRIGFETWVKENLGLFA